ncbi:MAG TPA: PPOX class F420-dependent oxidoreductase [Acidimicrobiales bacterium]|nr:PPOX class F420-dependent oxidoreductase [Acidimicrobiales bacterium]
MAYHRMEPDEIAAFLRAPVRTASVATTRVDGRPHVAPVWFDVEDDGTIVFNTGADTVKGRAIRRTGKVALCVQDDRPPFSFVVIEGDAAWSDEPGDLRAVAARIGGRYMGADRAEEYGARNGVPGELVVRVTPTRIVAEADLADD